MKFKSKIKSPTVTLVNRTQDAEDLLLFTKNTRLELTPSLMQEIKDWPLDKKLEELSYISNTIPSSWEFVNYVFCIQGVSRAYTHQQVRTRAASYAQQTMRVLNMGEFSYIYTDKNQESPEAVEIIDRVLTEIQKGYNELISIGQPAEDARGILPTNIETVIVCRFDLRMLSELAKSRTGGRTQGEYQKVVNQMIDCVLEIHPWAEKFFFKKDRDYFAEIEAFAKQKFPDLKERGELLKIVDAMRKVG
jgi:flavin-dependent thymidylate synthase